MRVAMISTPFVAVPPKNYGGTELVVYELVEGLVRRGHEVTLFATWDSRTSATLRSLYDEPRWPPDPMHDLNHVSWAMQQVRDGGYDLVHAHSAIALALSRVVSEIPLLYTLHHVRDETYSSYYGFFPDPQYIAISADQASREVPLEKLEVIHHGLDPNRYECVAQAEAHVCFIGRFSDIKGPHTAIDVAALAGVPIRVAGEIHPPDREYAEREVLPRLEAPHVTFVGSIGMSEKVPFFRSARALLVPITWNEPFGLVMVEAMLSGCPVVAFPRGSVPELVESGVTGFIVESEQEMAETIRPGGPLDRFDRRACRQRAVERFSTDKMVTRHEALYERVRSGRTDDRAAAGQPRLAASAQGVPERPARPRPGSTDDEGAI
jgi:glycosyltransferase involved in cell wall biosynthesis